MCAFHFKLSESHGFIITVSQFIEAVVTKSAEYVKVGIENTRKDRLLNKWLSIVWIVIWKKIKL